VRRKHATQKTRGMPAGQTLEGKKKELVSRRENGGDYEGALSARARERKSKQGRRRGPKLRAQRKRFRLKSNIRGGSGEMKGELITAAHRDRIRRKRKKKKEGMTKAGARGRYESKACVKRSLLGEKDGGRKRQLPAAHRKVSARFPSEKAAQK